MTSEMVSGPDLGGGFLFQLSLDRGEHTTSFTFHAQEGGQDANGPPRGSPTPLDFLPTPAPCQFGGPRCWHRPFVLDPTEALRVRVAYNRMRFVIEAMIDQVYGAAPVPLEASLTEFLQRVAPELAPIDARWSLDARTGQWLHGSADPPLSITLRTTVQGVDRLSEVWSDFLIEPTGWTELPAGQTVYGAAAFLGTIRSGARWRWYSVPTPSEPGPALNGTVPAETEAVDWKGHPVIVDAPGLVRPTAPVRGHHFEA